MNIRPLLDNILIEPLKGEEKTKSGILIPVAGSEEEPERGRVIAVGPGKKGKDGKVIPLEVKVGEIVLLAKYKQDKIKIAGKEYLIAKESDILAVIEGSDAEKALDYITGK